MRQSIRALTGPIHARIAMPGSKCITNRALILAALADGVSELFDILISPDTLTLLSALRHLGIVIQLDEQSRSCIVAGCAGQFPRTTAKIDCDNASGAARFLLAACAATAGTFDFCGAPELNAHPVAGLLKTLRSQGAKLDPVDAVEMPFTILGTDGLKGGEIDVQGSETSQFISALLMVAPFARHEVLLTMRSNVTTNYIDMTCAVMADFGVLVRRMHRAFYRVPAPQRYIARNYFIEPDLKLAAYFFAAAAVTGGKIKIQAVTRADSKQDDIEILDVLEKMGCIISDTSESLTVTGPAELHGISINMKNFPETFMAVAAIAPFASSPTTITNITHTHMQELNRIGAMRMGLEKLGVKVEDGPDWIRIFPSKPQPGIIDCLGDNYIAMAFALIALKVAGVEIEGAESVTRTCPDFFLLWGNLTNA
jgi:3-phosphoshikimate 1-carboxyvinyltransferase